LSAVARRAEHVVEGERYSGPAATGPLHIATLVTS
jgi:hypothetical protein